MNRVNRLMTDSLVSKGPDMCSKEDLILLCKNSLSDSELWGRSPAILALLLAFQICSLGCLILLGRRNCQGFERFE